MIATLVALASMAIQSNSDWVSITIRRRAVESSDGKLFLPKRDGYAVTILNAMPLQIPGNPRVLEPGEHRFKCDLEEELKTIIPDGDYVSTGSKLPPHKFRLSKLGFPDFVTVDNPEALKSVDPSQPLHLHVQGVKDGAEFSVEAIDAQDSSYFKGDFVRSKLPGFQKSYRLLGDTLVNESNLDSVGNELGLDIPASFGSGIHIAVDKLSYDATYVMEMSSATHASADHLSIRKESVCSTALKTSGYLANGQKLEGALSIPNSGVLQIAMTQANCTAACKYVEPSHNALWGAYYTITQRLRTPNNLHDGTPAPDTGSHSFADPNVMFVHITPTDSVMWHAKVYVKPHRLYEFRCWAYGISQPTNYPYSFHVLMNGARSEESYAPYGHWGELKQLWSSGTATILDVAVIANKQEHDCLFGLSDFTIREITP